jgi:flagellar biosynthetic protein FliO
MLRKKIIPILAFGLLFVVGQVLVRGNASPAASESAADSESSAPGEPNLVTTSDLFTIDHLDLGSGSDAERGKMIKQFAYAVFLVVILGTGAFYLTRKVIPKLSMSKGKNISVIETVSLGPNRRIHLIEVGGSQRLLLGSTNQSINLLAHVGDSIPEYTPAPAGEED